MHHHLDNQENTGASEDWVVGEFSKYCPRRRLPMLAKGIQVLREARLSIIEIADALYSSPRILDALTDAEFEEARKLTFSRLSESLEELRESGVPEDHLRLLNDSGFAVGEIALAIRNIIGLREDLVSSSAEEARKLVPVLHEFFHNRAGGTARARQSPLGARQPAPVTTPGQRLLDHGSTSMPGSWRET